MTSEQVQLVKRTWRLLRDIHPAVLGDTFYSKLFADNAALRRLFPKDMQSQYVKLMDMLSTIVSRLDRPGEISNDITRMAQRHAAYGVRPAHYRLVGHALLWTLEHGLGKDWTPAAKEAWTQCYNELSAAMLDASPHSN